MTHCELCHRPLPHNADEQRACDAIVYANNKGTTIVSPPKGPGRWVTEGESIVIMRRMEALQEAIRNHSPEWADVTLSYDQVHRALTKAFGLPR